MNNNILELNGLSIEILKSLSFKSHLPLSLNRTLRHFDKTELIKELTDMTNWLDEQTLLADVALDYRIKSLESIVGKYNRYYPNKPVKQVFNDVLGFRAFCDTYKEILELDKDLFHIADMSQGKLDDDGYRGVHVYFQIDNSFYPIEIQFNTLYDRQINNWLHDYLYKKDYPNSIGCIMRTKYEHGLIKTDIEFEEVLKDVLSGC